ncbi:MAG: hypothetical protein U1E32_05435, partial [Rhodoglobus sp.]|nr:hypothetical protein [Rhodoglobus sp.]
MSIIRTVPESEATGLVADLYAEDLADLGYVPSHSQVMAINPEAVRAFQALAATIAKPLGMRNYELVTLAAAEAIGSDACRLAHSRKSLKYMDAEEVVAVVTDYRSAGLSPAEVAMMDFAARLSADSSTMTDADAEALREHGFSDREIVDIALAAGLRNFYSRAARTLGRRGRASRGPRRSARRARPLARLRRDPEADIAPAARGQSIRERVVEARQPVSLPLRDTEQRERPGRAQFVGLELSQHRVHLGNRDEAPGRPAQPVR